MPVAGLQIGVTSAEIDGAVTDANIGEPIGIIVADGNVTSAIHHMIMNPVAPLQLNGRIKISIGNERVLKKSLECVAKRSRQGAGETRRTPARVADNWPPSTGSAKVCVGAMDCRSA